jgi:hypothetical protein
MTFPWQKESIPFVYIWKPSFAGRDPSGLTLEPNLGFLSTIWGWVFSASAAISLKSEPPTSHWSEPPRELDWVNFPTNQNHIDKCANFGIWSLGFDFGTSTSSRFKIGFTICKKNKIDQLLLVRMLFSYFLFCLRSQHVREDPCLNDPWLYYHYQMA